MCYIYSYNAAAVVTVEDGINVPYLDKFAVSNSKQGEGCGDILWESIKTNTPQLYWRSRTTNKINPWWVIFYIKKDYIKYLHISQNAIMCPDSEFFKIMKHLSNFKTVVLGTEGNVQNKQ